MLEARPGIYRRPVAGLDFASLYPSIMQAYNLCPSTRSRTERPGYLRVGDEWYRQAETEEDWDRGRADPSRGVPGRAQGDAREAKSATGDE